MQPKGQPKNKKKQAKRKQQQQVDIAKVNKEIISDYKD